MDRCAQSDVNKAALSYLAASKATAICIVESDGVCTFQLKFDPGAISIYWLRDEQAKALLKQARHDAGRAPDAVTAEAALHGAARDQGITLTAHRKAIEPLFSPHAVTELAPWLLALAAHTDATVMPALL
jgi:hypothetical protein